MLSYKRIRKAVPTILTVLIAFVGGWYYLDQQRIKVGEEKTIIAIHKAELKIQEQDYKNRIQSLKITENKIQQKYQQQSRDEELSKLTLKYIDEVAGVDLGKTCGDDPKHNAKVKKGKALLSLIEAKALEYNRKDLVETFVQDQRSGYGAWSANCNVHVSEW